MESVNTVETEQNDVKKGISEKLYNVKDVIQYLSTKFPNCFFQDKKEIQPLKIGIFEDVVKALESDETYSKTAIRKAIRVYTANLNYLSTFKENVYRIDLDGNKVNVLTADEIAHSSKCIEEIKLKLAEKKKKFFEEHPELKNNLKKPFKKKNHSKTDEADQSEKPRKKFNSNNVELVRATEDQITVGSYVYVMIGSRRNGCVVEKIEKDNIIVKLRSGMDINTKAENIFVKKA